jgi:hypothetical protein
MFCPVVSGRDQWCCGDSGNAITRHGWVTDTDAVGDSVTDRRRFLATATDEIVSMKRRGRPSALPRMSAKEAILHPGMRPM